MTYKIAITPRAAQDLAEYAGYIAKVRQEPAAAVKWLKGAIDAAQALSAFPKSWPVVPEQDQFDVEIRHTVYHSHRILFEVREAERTVYVHRFHHTSRNSLTSEE